MSIKKTLGGDRIGSGNKMQVRLHNYERSTHNLSRVWRSSMAAGTLTPCFVEPGLNGDTFDIDITTKVRTLPTTGPLFGSFKMQIDMFACPIRLYQGLLHNNAVKIGMEMSKVLIPKIQIKSLKRTEKEESEYTKFNASSLLSYLGLSGMGATGSGIPTETEFQREFNALPLLAYWDIFKNYYSNKQEDHAYYITSETYEINQNQQIAKTFAILKAKQIINGGGGSNPSEEDLRDASNVYLRNTKNTTNFDFGGVVCAPIRIDNTFSIAFDKGVKPKPENVSMYFFNNQGTLMSSKFNEVFPNYEYQQVGDNWLLRGVTSDITNRNNPHYELVWSAGNVSYIKLSGILIQQSGAETEFANIKIKEFPLENLDKMRQHILKMCGLGDKVTITNTGTQDTETGNINIEPYSVCADRDGGGTLNRYPMNGIAIKTYNSDIFNNWLNSEWIDGDNGIAAISAVSTESGSITMDALNLAQKVYNMLNRIAVAGGTYEDWQEAVYGQDAIRRAESPIYIGGASTEIVFDEVVATTENDTSDGKQSLGSLGGRGVAVNKKGGHVKIKTTEPSFIIGIVSITPRIDYFQGNKWWNYTLDSIDDLHKPALDGIGFQDLIEEQMLYSTTTINKKDGSEITQKAAGKQPSWIHYMTSYNEIHGDFAEENKALYMVLARRYKGFSEIEDLTTYINPQDYNYAFADTSLEAQNFWVQIGFDVKTRRKMSAKMIPNL